MYNKIFFVFLILFIDIYLILLYLEFITFFIAFFRLCLANIHVLVFIIEEEINMGMVFILILGLFILIFLLFLSIMFISFTLSLIDLRNSNSICPLICCSAMF